MIVKYFEEVSDIRSHFSHTKYMQINNLTIPASEYLFLKMFGFIFCLVKLCKSIKTQGIQTNILTGSSQKNL